MNAFLKLVKKLALLILIIFILDLFIGAILKRAYFAIQTGTYGNLTYQIEKSNEDLIILGSSRAQYHYNSGIIEEFTHYSTLNAGYGGQSTIYYNAIFNCIIKRYTPKFIAIDLIPYSISISNDSFDKLSCLLPYYDRHPEIHELIRQKSEFERFKVLSKIYCYNSTPGNILKEKLNPTTEINKGFIPIRRTIDSTSFPNNPTNIKFDIDERQILSLQRIIDNAKSRDIKIILIISPLLYTDNNFKDLALYLNKYVDNKSVFLLDYSDSTQFKKYTFFSDPVHLNDFGATCFSSVFANDILHLPL